MAHSCANKLRQEKDLAKHKDFSEALGCIRYVYVYQWPSGGMISLDFEVVTSSIHSYG